MNYAKLLRKDTGLYKQVIWDEETQPNEMTIYWQQKTNKTYNFFPARLSVQWLQTAASLVV